ncbi:MAG: phosphatidate cytidylyltransferase [Alphaproteobacteria bacterium]
MSSTSANDAMAQPASDAGSHGIGLRVVSALVMVPVALGLAYAGGFAFNLLVLGSAVLMVHEWNGLSSGRASIASAATGGAVVGCVGIAAVGHSDAGLAAVIPMAGLTLAAAWLAGMRNVWPPLGVVYVAVPSIAVIWLRADESLGLETIIWLFAVVWATDIGAYFAGRGIGGPKLAPRISPNKTWAGLGGGVMAAALVGAVTAAVLDVPGGLALILFSAVLAVVAQIGDLAESVVKRHFGAKDSGQLIPGHGGVLDRLDGLMAAAPAVALVALVSGEGALIWQ